MVIFQLVCQAKLFSEHFHGICKPSCSRWRLGLRTFHVCVCSARLEREMLWRWNTFEQIFFECFDTRSQRKSFWPNKHERLIKQIWKIDKKIWKIDQTNMKDWSNKYECNCRPWKIIKIHFTITGGFFGSRQYQARAGHKRITSFVVVRLPREDRLLTSLF